MKKLNEKGFAVSTMLYGILTMIILILMLLLGIMRSSYNKIKNAEDDIRYYLDKCSSKQIALENCFKSYNSGATPYSCGDEYELYTACIGREQISQSSGSVALLTNLLIDNADASETGLMKDSLVENRYIFAGSNPNNYVKFGSKEGRIISIEPNGTIKIVLSDAITGAFDKTTTTSTNSSQIWRASTLYNTFKTRYNSMDYISKITKGNFYTGVIYETYSTKNALESIRASYVEDSFGLLTLEDYLKASSNIKSSCDLTATGSSTIQTAMTNCKSNNWLVSGISSQQWTSTAMVSGSNLNNFVTFSSAGGTKTVITATGNARMVIYLRNGILADIKGIGSKTNPYVIN